GLLPAVLAPDVSATNAAGAVIQVPAESVQTATNAAGALLDALMRVGFDIQQDPQRRFDLGALRTDPFFTQLGDTAGDGGLVAAAFARMFADAIGPSLDQF